MPATSSSNCSVPQREELDVLESIYPDCVSSEQAGGSLKLEIPIEFGRPTQISLTCSEDYGQDESHPLLLSLSVLPPLLLHLILPPDYPLYSPPEIISIRATHLWLPYSHKLQSILAEMWQPGEGVLYNWVEFIRAGEFLNALGILTPDAHIPHPAPRLLAPLLISYEKSTKETEFTNNSYPCAVCLTAYKGSKCLQLACSHIFCRTCLEDFWTLCITEGDVGRVGCPDPECVKAGREANEEEVARVVTDQDLQRWRWLREKRALEKDPSVVHCPMPFCQTPVSKNPIDDDEESPWGRLRECPACSFSFCAFCKRTWHGPVAKCPTSQAETVVLEYLASAEGSVQRRTMERQFGKTTLAKLVATYREEQENKKWLKSFTMACPGCDVNVEKSLGCNHMTCAKCKQHFCFRCGQKINARNPYVHFSTPGQPCFNKLFDFTSEDLEWQPIEGFDAL